MSQISILAKYTNRTVAEMTNWLRLNRSCQARRAEELLNSNEAILTHAYTGIDVESDRGYVMTVPPKGSAVIEEPKPLETERAIDVLQNHVDKLNPNSEAAEEITAVIDFLKSQNK